MLPNGADPVAALFGVWRAGGVYVPLNPRLTGRRGRPHHGVGRPGGHRDHRRAGRAVRGTVRTVGLVVSPTSDGLRRTGPGVVRSGRLARHDADVALIQFTSGTTGRPKPVLLLHSGVLTLLDGVLAKLRTGPSRSAADRRSRAAEPAGADAEPDPGVAVAVGRASTTCCSPSGSGRPSWSWTASTPPSSPRSCARFGIRSTVLPPAAMTMLADDPDDHRPGAAALRAQHHRARCRRCRPAASTTASASRVLNSYGQTEIGGEIVGLERGRLAGPRRDQARVGRADPTTACRSGWSTSDGADLAVDEPGELWVLTPALSAGYADGSDLSDRLSADGWFRTGDFARIDADGFVWIEGRVSSMINRGGLKVYPGRGRGGPPPAPGGGRRRRGRRARRPAGRGPVGLRRARHGLDGAPDRTGASCEAVVPRAPRALQGAGPASRRSPRCPATRWARSSPGRSSTRSGPADDRTDPTPRGAVTTLERSAGAGGRGLGRRRPGLRRAGRRAAGPRSWSAARRADRLDEIVAEAGGGRAVAGDVARRGRPPAHRRPRPWPSSVPSTCSSTPSASRRCSMLADTDADDWRSLFETNVIGLQRVLAGLVPAHGRAAAIAAVLSSEIVGRPRPASAPTASSKAARQRVAAHLAARAPRGPVLVHRTWAPPSPPSSATASTWTSSSRCSTCGPATGSCSATSWRPTRWPRCWPASSAPRSASPASASRTSPCARRLRWARWGLTRQ